MEPNSMPEPLRRSVHTLVGEAVMNCQEVLRYTEPDQAHDWKRMTLYRATDAADTLDMASLLIAAYLEQSGMSNDTLHAYLQSKQQHSRAAGPQACDRAYVSGLLGGPAPEGGDRMDRRFEMGQIRAESAQRAEDDPEYLWTQACLHGLRARLCDDVDALDSYLLPHVAELARKVAGALEVPQPATA